MCPWQVSEAHQELVDDLTAGKTKRPPEQPCPFFRRARMMRIEPARERSVRSTQPLDAARILDRRLNLEPVTDYPRIGEQAFGIGRRKGGDAIDLEIGKRRAEGRALPEYRQPRQAGLIDFQD